MNISVIIPSLNEAENITETVRSIGPDTEVIVVDGGSTDSTVTVAKELGANVISSEQGRGTQMDTGAGVSTGDVLLFLHADTALPPSWQELVNEALEQPGAIGGAFQLYIDSGRRALSIVAAGANLRARLLGLIYGDQAIFAKRSAFFAAGGFAKLPLMEDVYCVKKLRKLGRIVLVDASVSTSARRWAGESILRTTLRNWLLVSLYFVGISPAKLHKRYYQNRTVAPRGLHK